MNYDTLIPLGFFALFVVMFGGTLLVAARSVKKARANLLGLAQTMGLEVIEKPARPIVGRPVPSLAGQFRGREIRVHTYSTGSGKSRVQWVAISAKVSNSSGYSLRMSAENILTRAGRAFGITDVETGDPEFDSRVYLKSNDPGFTRVALLPEIRRKVLEAWKNSGARGTLTVEGDEVKYAETGSFARAQVIKRFPAMAELVCDFCEITETRG